MKTIYLVRHGETNANLAHVWQDANDELSLQGYKQAENLAQRLAHESFDKAFCSSFKRAVQTAEVISQKLQIEFEASSLLVEAKVPTSTVGIKQEKVPGNIIYEYLTQRDTADDRDNFRFEDEETLSELVSRAQAALQMLATCKAEKILVITHGTFLRTLVNVVLNQHEPDRLASAVFYGGRYLQTTNTGITVINRLDEDNSPWTLLTFNDHAHFAE